MQVGEVKGADYKLHKVCSLSRAHQAFNFYKKGGEANIMAARKKEGLRRYLGKTRANAEKVKVYVRNWGCQVVTGGVIISSLAGEKIANVVPRPTAAQREMILHRGFCYL